MDYLGLCGSPLIEIQELRRVKHSRCPKRPNITTIVPGDMPNVLVVEATCERCRLLNPRNRRRRLDLCPRCKKQTTPLFYETEAERFETVFGLCQNCNVLVDKSKGSVVWEVV